MILPQKHRQYPSSSTMIENESHVPRPIEENSCVLPSQPLGMAHRRRGDFRVIGTGESLAFFPNESRLFLDDGFGNRAGEFFP